MFARTDALQVMVVMVTCTCTSYGSYGDVPKPCRCKNSYLTVIVVHEMHGRIRPDYCQIHVSIKLAHDPFHHWLTL